MNAPLNLLKEKNERMKQCPQCDTGYPDSHATCPTHGVPLSKMRKWRITRWILALVIGAAVLPALSQQDEGPILRPRKPLAKPAGATLLVTCDLACNWKLDGEAKGQIYAGGSAKAKVEPGQHVVVAVTEDGADQVKQLTKVEEKGQTAVSLDLSPIRDARLKAEREATDKAAQEARDKATREQATRDDTARLQDLRDHAAERFSQGKALYDQKRYEAARPLLEKACEGGEMAGCDSLGLLYEGDQGVPQDFSLARTFFQKACDGGFMDACSRLGFLFYNGQGVSKDYYKAFTLYQKACDGGSMDGCDSLGNLYRDGQGVNQDFAQARTLYQKACDGGDMGGCTYVGNCYRDGHGVPQSYSEARTFFQKACDVGLMAGCNNLGNLYNDGLGVARNYVQARTLYQRACEGGIMAACARLGNLCTSLQPASYLNKL